MGCDILAIIKDGEKDNEMKLGDSGSIHESRGLHEMIKMTLYKNNN